MKSFLEKSRYAVIFGIIGSFMSSLVLYIFGLAGVFFSIYKAIMASHPLGPSNLKEISVELIQVIDIFLLATVIYIIALGLYELFIDDALELPKWLEVKTLDDLKARLLGVVVVILPVTFLGKLVEWKNGIDILWLGLAVGAVVIAISAFQLVGVAKKRRK